MTSSPLVDGRGVSLQDEAAARVGGLFERHGRMVYGVCRAMLRDVHEAEDAAQQVFLSAHGALLGGAQIRDPGRWLAAIARNECRGRIVAGMWTPLPVANEDLELVPELRDEGARREQAHDLREALAALPERQREVVVLRYVYGLRYREVAVALGLSRPATEALLFRARRALRRRLGSLAGAALVVPASLREELALALPGFGGSSAGSGAAAAGVTGGLLAKLTAGPVGVKVATSAVAISTVGAVGAAPSEHAQRTNLNPTVVVGRSSTTEEPRPTAPGSSKRMEASSDSSTSRSARSGRTHGDEADDRSGSGSSGESGDDRRGPSRSQSGAGRAEPIEDDTETTRSGPSVGESDSSGPSESSGTAAPSSAPEDDAKDGSNSGPGSAGSEGSGVSNSGSDSSGEDSGSSGRGSVSSGPSD